MAKELKNLYWVEDLLPKASIKKSMFGGHAFYLDQKLILVMFESEGTRSYKNKKYDFEIWNGCMFPVEPSVQPEVKKNLEFLINHPVLPKWLYLPLETDDFESKVEIVMRQLRKPLSLFGTIPKSKKSKISTSQNLRSKKDESVTKVNMKRPQMFQDEPARVALEKAKNVSDLKNLGPTSEANFKAVGVKSAQQLIKMGWKKSLTLLVARDPRHAHSLYAYALIGALTNKDWSQLSENEKDEAREFSATLREKLKSKKKKKSPNKKSLKKNPNR